MARERSPNRDKAYELWKESDGKLTASEIANKLKVSVGMINKWKNLDKWELKPKGAPKRNQNSVTHGAYRSVYQDCLSNDELDLMASLTYDEEQMLTEQIALLTIRERRLLQSIMQYQELELEQVHNREMETIRDSSGISERETVRVTASRIDVIGKLEAELTKVQGKKTKCIESLAKIRADKLKGNDTKEADVAKILRGVFYGDRAN